MPKSRRSRLPFCARRPSFTAGATEHPSGCSRCQPASRSFCLLSSLVFADPAPKSNCPFSAPNFGLRFFFASCLRSFFLPLSGILHKQSRIARRVHTRFDPDTKTSSPPRTQLDPSGIRHVLRSTLLFGCCSQFSVLFIYFSSPCFSSRSALPSCRHSALQLQPPSRVAASSTALLSIYLVPPPRIAPILDGISLASFCLRLIFFLDLPPPFIPLFF